MTSREVAKLYAAVRKVPANNIVGIHLPIIDMIDPARFLLLRQEALTALPTKVQSLVLIWSKPYAVGCMSITTAFAAGYRAAFCEPGCSVTATNPLFNANGWLPADTVGWWPAMLLPTSDLKLAAHLIRTGVASDATAPSGMVYLVNTQDPRRNVRSTLYPQTNILLANRIQ